ncbi:MAG: tRNA (N(6)-L-threonylcarbamoyladenosine(37)-C(2))-methylthiotransferase [Candidatus Woesearchaeota archaeon]
MKRIAILTFGCSLNQADSEIMKHLIKERIKQKKDLRLVKNPKNAEIVIVNTCAVKKPTEIHMLRIIKELENLSKKVIVCGCLAQTMPEYFKNLSLLGTEDLERINEAIDATNENRIVKFLNNKYEKLSSIEKCFHNKVIEIIPISRGCLGNCTYCITKIARGNLRSYPPEKIIERIKLAVKKGIKEIWLSSQDSFCYGFDIGTNIVELMKEINKINSDFKVRIGMGNPNHLKLFLDDMLLQFSDKFFKFLHIPVQTGSNKILREMNRYYSVEEFVELVQKIREYDPLFSIATDIMVGFPSETQEDFEETLKLIEIIKPDVVNISRFGKRPKTILWNVKELMGKEVKKRSRILTMKCNEVEFERNKIWIGKYCKVLIDEKNKQNLVGRNDYYKPIVIKSTKISLGEWVITKVIDAKPHFLISEL